MNIFLRTCLLLCTIGYFAFAATLSEEHAEITAVLDGDTIDVRIDGQSEDSRIRIVGIQAMEIDHTDSSDLNDCFADEATQRLTEITGGVGAQVILRAKNPDQRDRFGRLPRHVFVKDGDKEIDVSKQMLEEGLVLPMEYYDEDTYAEAYFQVAQEARRAQIGLWSPTNHCQTSADSEDVNFEIVVHYDANGDDYDNLEDEWVKIKNHSGRSVDLSHWWLRDSALHFFRFPASTVIGDDEELIIRGGTGTSTADELFWGNSEPIFSNSKDGIYLQDYLDYDAEDTETTYSPKGNLKASFIYPCIGTCTDALQGKIDLIAHYDAQGDDTQNVNDEWVRISNISDEDINLENYLLHYSLSGSREYTFERTDTLHPGESMLIHMGKGSDSRLVKYVGRSTPILSNSSGKVWMTTYDRILIDAFSWPCTTNCTDPLSSKVTIGANYDAAGDDMKNPNGEWITVKNTSSGEINLRDYLLKYGANGSQSYFFEDDTILYKGETLYLYMGKGTSSRLVKYAGRESGILANSGGSVQLARLDGVTVDSYSWPTTTTQTTSIKSSTPTSKTVNFIPILLYLVF